MMEPGVLLVLQISVPIIVCVLAYKTRALDGTSALAGAVMGYVIILAQDFNWFIAFLGFYIAGSAATKYRYREKSEYGVSQKKRKVENVLGNGLMALIFAFGGNIYGFTHLAIYGFFASLAAATSDTLSSEVGVLSPKKPVSVLDFKTPVNRGVNGGVTNLGNTFMFFGAGFIGFIGMALFNDWVLFWVSLWGGVFGCMVDSILGATVENKGTLGNSTVNFLATLAGGTFGIALAYGATLLTA